jgi:hypothetical protein
LAARSSDLLHLLTDGGSVQRLKPLLKSREEGTHGLELRAPR